MDVGGQWLLTGAKCKCIQKHPKARIYPTHDSRACVCMYLTELPNSPTINIIKYLLDSIPFLFAYRTSWNSFRGFLQLQEPSYARLPSERGANLNPLRKEEGASASATACMQIQYIAYWFLYVVYVLYVYTITHIHNAHSTIPHETKYSECSMCHTWQFPSVGTFEARRHPGINVANYILHNQELPHIISHIFIQ